MSGLIGQRLIDLPATCGTCGGSLAGDPGAAIGRGDDGQLQIEGWCLRDHCPACSDTQIVSVVE